MVVFVCAPACVHTCGGQKSIVSIFLSCSALTLTELELAAGWAPGILRSCLPRVEIPDTCHFTLSFLWFSGSELRSLCCATSSSPLSHPPIPREVFSPSCMLVGGAGVEQNFAQLALPRYLCLILGKSCLAAVVVLFNF